MNATKIQTNSITWLSIAFFTTFCATVDADVRLGSPFGDNMVLQRDVELPIWGWSDPGDDIVVFAQDQTVTTQADQNGKWIVRLQPMGTGDPFSIRIKGSHNEVEIENVVMGEVWICSGQSNMEWTVESSKNPAKEIAAANYPMIRHMKVLHHVSATPLDDCQTTGWQVCSPTTVGSFTAVGYFFGRQLHQDLNVPIGLINSSWGGTIVEAWTSADSLKTHPDFADRIRVIEANFAQSKLEAARAQFESDIQRWQQEYDDAVKISDQQSQPNVDDSNWKQLDAPGNWEQQGFPNVDGIAWYRKNIELPESWLGKELVLSLGQIDDADRTFVNGSKIGETRGWNNARKYTVPATVNSNRRLTVSVQVNDTGGVGGFRGKTDQMSISTVSEKPISLAGKWKFKVSDAMAQLSPRPKPPGFNGPNNPTALYNSMIHPLIPSAFKGVIWYQGEANAGRAFQYRSLFPMLIKDWRAKWNRPLPFYWVQLANFRATNDTPVESNWAELREAQSMALNLPNTGEAVIIDIGNARDIHPKNKQDVGKRLAWHALKNNYGRDIANSGPRYREMKIEGNKIRLMFDHALALKSSDGQPLSQFSIAGTDKKFVWAVAQIEGSDVLVAAPTVDQPAAVRYAWSNSPAGCNLTNGSGIPASPFRTDDWPGITVDKK